MLQRCECSAVTVIDGRQQLQQEVVAHDDARHALHRLRIRPAGQLPRSALRPALCQAREDQPGRSRRVAARQRACRPHTTLHLALARCMWRGAGFICARRFTSEGFASRGAWCRTKSQRPAVLTMMRTESSCGTCKPEHLTSRSAAASRSTHTIGSSVAADTGPARRQSPRSCSKRRLVVCRRRLAGPPAPPPVQHAAVMRSWCCG